MIAIRLTRFALALALLLGAAAPASARTSNKWRLQCSEGAKSTGVIVFRFEFKDAADFDVVVQIPDGTSENHVARIIRDTFREKLDPAKFHVEVDDGEDVLVKAQSGQPDFGIKVTKKTVKAVRINMDRE
jgi:hypothetical protein